MAIVSFLALLVVGCAGAIKITVNDTALRGELVEQAHTPDSALCDAVQQYTGEPAPHC